MHHHTNVHTHVVTKVKLLLNTTTDSQPHRHTHFLKYYFTSTTNVTSHELVAFRIISRF